MNRFIGLFMVVFFLVLSMTGCRGVDVQGASGASVMASPELPLTEVVPSPTATAVPTPLPTPSSTPLPTPTSTPDPTPTPFFCTYLRGQTEAGSFVSEAMREEVRYLVHLPPCYEAYPDKAFPVLYLLHGWPLDERHWESMGADELADDWVSRGLVGPYILVMPGVSSEGLFVNSSGGDHSFEGMLVDELVPLIDGAYHTWRDPSGRGIGGISRGGVWSIEIALRHPDIFGIMGAHSPALALNHPMPQYDPFRLAKDGAPGLRIYLDAGDVDWARASTIRLRDLLQEKGADVTYQVHTGGHVDALWQGALEDYMDFYTADWPRSYDALPLWVNANEN